MRSILTALSLCLTHALAPAQDFASAIKAGLAQAEASKSFALAGIDPSWRFLVNELKHLQHGDLSAADLAQVNIEHTDPIPEIVRYSEELKALGVELLLVPVPAKASIYPEKLAANPGPLPTMTAFFAKLASGGVQVLDLESAFLAAKKAAPDRMLYCATDSHWSPAGAALAAQLVAAKYKSRTDWAADQLRDLVKLKPETLEFHGDLLTDTEKASMPKEKLPLTRSGIASNPDGTEVKPVESAEDAPLLVMGDSHCQVFRRGASMHTTCGGFIDHLTTDLSLPVEEISTQASGGEGPRIDIARRTVKEPDFWKKKKVVVWLFSAREFTQGRWKKIPAVVQKR
jgi:alginate O-acetyltransferase complex protein AlgJ